MSNHRLPKCLEVHSRQNVCARSYWFLSNQARDHLGVWYHHYLGYRQYLSICLLGGAGLVLILKCDKKMELRFEVWLEKICYVYHLISVTVRCFLSVSFIGSLPFLDSAGDSISLSLHFNVYLIDFVITFTADNTLRPLRDPLRWDLEISRTSWWDW